MRYYFFGDIHGNEYALERCFKHLDEIKPDGIYCLGDLVGWLPFGNRTLQQMRSLNVPTVAGNHDLMVAGLIIDHPEQLDRMQASAYNAGLLSMVPGAFDYLSSLPLILEESDFVLAHHSPFHLPERGREINIESFNYLDKTAIVQCLESWRAYTKRIIFSGHDHVSAVFELPESDRPPKFEDIIVHQPKDLRPFTVKIMPHAKYWVKAGSVGGPYRDGIAVCNSVLFDRSLQTITLFRLPYPSDRLYQELDSHRFYRNLPTIKNYLNLLAKSVQ
ncbi:MAG: metallophosphoesterase [Desulforhabdus sp.]|jgi:predicted phosphodiesterase|nr:metallophosphoesterase [Desulforhabdus sp.]